MITKDRVEKAVEYFRDNAERHGALVGRVKAVEHELKVVFEQEKLKALGNNPKLRISEAEARARTSPSYKAILDDLENAWADKTELETRFEYGRMVYGLWRDENK